MQIIRLLIPLAWEAFFIGLSLRFPRNTLALGIFFSVGILLWYHRDFSLRRYFRQFRRVKALWLPFAVTAAAELAIYFLVRHLTGTVFPDKDISLVSVWTHTEFEIFLQAFWQILLMPLAEELLFRKAMIYLPASSRGKTKDTGASGKTPAKAVPAGGPSGTQMSHHSGWSGYGTAVRYRNDGIPKEKKTPVDTDDLDLLFFDTDYAYDEDADYEYAASIERTAAAAADKTGIAAAMTKDTAAPGADPETDKEPETEDLPKALSFTLSFATALLGLLLCAPLHVRTPFGIAIAALLAAPLAVVYLVMKNIYPGLTVHIAGAAFENMPYVIYVLARFATR